MTEIHNNISIRDINKADLELFRDTVIRLLSENYRINFADREISADYAVGGYQGMLRFKDDNSAIIIGAFQDDELVGFLWAYQRNVLGIDRLHINHIIVHEDHRMKGIGAGLINRLLVKSDEMGIDTIELMTSVDNEDTVKFYKNLGFIETRVLLEKRIRD